MLSSGMLDSILTFLGLICALHKILSEEGLFHTDFKKALMGSQGFLKDTVGKP